MTNKIKTFFLPPNSNAKNRALIFLWFSICFLMCVLLGLLSGYYLGKSNNALMDNIGKDRSVTASRQNYEVDSLRKQVSGNKMELAKLNGDIDSLAAVCQPVVEYEFNNPTRNLDLKDKLENLGVDPKSGTQTIKLALHNCIVHFEQIQNSFDSLQRAKSTEVRMLSANSVASANDVTRRDNENRQLMQENTRLTNENLRLKASTASQTTATAKTDESGRKLEYAIRELNRKKRKRDPTYTADNILSLLAGK